MHSGFVYSLNVSCCTIVININCVIVNSNMIAVRLDFIYYDGIDYCFVNFSDFLFDFINNYFMINERYLFYMTIIK